MDYKIMEDLQKIVPEFAKTKDNKVNVGLVLTVLVLLLVIIGLIIGVVVLGVKVKPASNKGLNPGLLESSAAMLAAMNSSLDPCDNFYRFVYFNYITINR